jgi:hypothetical protein
MVMHSTYLGSVKGTRCLAGWLLPHQDCRACDTEEDRHATLRCVLIINNCDGDDGARPNRDVSSEVVGDADARDDGSNPADLGKADRVAQTQRDDGVLVERDDLRLRF